MAKKAGSPGNTKERWFVATDELDENDEVYLRTFEELEEYARDFEGVEFAEVTILSKRFVLEAKMTVTLKSVK